MCGIVGYVGGQQAAPILLEGLTRLEHRGYDSAGVAVLGRQRASRSPSRPAGCVTSTDGAAQAVRRQGRHRPHPLGHPRPGQRRQRPPAHRRRGRRRGRPQRHHRQRRGAAAAAGRPRRRAGLRHRHRGARAPGRALGRADTLEGRVRDALAAIDGTYGIAVMHADFPDRLVVARNGSPLIIGVGDKEMHVASDLAALVRYTTTVAHLDDGELATLTATGFTTYREDLTHDRQGTPRRSTSTPRRTTPATTTSFMHKEMLEQPDGGRAGAARPARRAVRHRPPRRAEHGRPRHPGDPAGQDPRLRLGVLRRPDGRRADRGAGPDPRGRRGGQRVPLPQPDHRAGHALRRGQPVRRDHRHPARRPGDPPQGRPGDRPGQRRRQRDRPRVRRRHLPARRARGRGRVDQGADQHVRRVRAARAAARPGARPVDRRRQAADRRPDRGCPARSRRSSSARTSWPRWRSGWPRPRACSSSAGCAASRSPARARRSSRRSPTGTPRPTRPPSSSTARWR